MTQTVSQTSLGADLLPAGAARATVRAGPDVHVGTEPTMRTQEIPSKLPCLLAIRPVGPTLTAYGGDLASTGGRRLSLRAEVVTHLVNLVALLVMIIADDNYALAA